MGIAPNAVSWGGGEVYNCSCTDVQTHSVLVTYKSQVMPAAFEKRFRHDNC